MSRASWAAQLKERADVERTKRSARLGRTLRSVLVDPAAGFRALARDAYGGPAPHVLTALGAAGLMSIWLKFGGLFGRRAIGRADFEWTHLAAAFVIAMVVGVIARFVWSALMVPVARRLGSRPPARTLRVVWGAALLPLAFGLIALVPLDLVVVGPEIFATEPLGGSDTVWASISIAIAAVLVVWWLYLLARGVGAVAGASALKASIAPVLAVVTLLACAYGMRLLLVSVARWTL